MDKYKIKDYTERLKKETHDNAQKMLYMWIKQEVISLNEYRALVKNIEVIHCCTELVCDDCNGFGSNVKNSTGLNEACLNCGR